MSARASHRVDPPPTSPQLTDAVNARKGNDTP